MTRLSDKIPVPELDDARIERIERGVLAAVSVERGTRGRLRSWALPALTLAMAAAAVALWIHMRGARVPLPAPIEVASMPATVVTEAGQSATVTLGDATLSVGESTHLSLVHRPDGSTLVELAQGHVHCDVAKRPHRPRFQVLSDDVTVTVVGTAFSVSRHRAVEVVVERGVVSVATSNEDVTLHAGDSWRGSPDPTIALAVIDAEASAVDLEPADVSMPDVHVPVRKNRPAPPRLEPDPNIEKLLEPTPEPHAELRAIRPPAPTPPAGAPAELLRIDADDPRGAARAYQDYALSRTGSEASFALYARAYLQLVELRAPGAALKTAQMYERRFPSGAEAESILWIRIRALCETNDAEGCRVAAHSYLRRYPGGRFAEHAGALINF